MATINLKSIADAGPILERQFDDALKEVLEETLERVKSKTPVNTGKARAGWKIDGDAVVNDVDYIDDLEFGSSQQAPNGMIGTTLTELPGVISKAFSK